MMKARYAISFTLLVVLLLSTFAMVHEPPTAGAESTQDGEWIEYPFDYPMYDDVLIDVGEDCMAVAVEESSSMLFFDINNSAWVELTFDTEQTFKELEVEDEGHVIFAYSDEFLIGYSSLLSQYDTRTYAGDPLQTNYLYDCSENLAFFLTTERLYVFDAELGYWQDYDYGLPLDYSGYGTYQLADDHVAVFISRESPGQPKNVVYSLHTHSFNQLDQGCFYHGYILDHGFVSIDAYPDETHHYHLTGYSAYTNEFLVVDVIDQGYLCSNTTTSESWGDKTAYAVSFRQSIPNEWIRADFHGYDTRLGAWSHITKDFGEDEGYSSTWQHGGQFVVDTSISGSGGDYTYHFIIYSGETGLFTTTTTEWNYGSVTSFMMCGGRVFVVADYNQLKAWAYDLVNETWTEISIDGENTVNRIAADDYATFSRWSDDSDTMTTYFYNGRNNSWSTAQMAKKEYSGSNSHNEHVFVFAPYSLNREAIFYSSIVDEYTKCQFPDDSTVYTSVKGVLASARSDDKSYLFDAETGVVHEFAFEFNGSVGSASASYFEENDDETYTLYGYSTLSREWTTLTVDKWLYGNYSSKGYIGLVTTRSATRTDTGYYAYNSLKDSWVELVPEGSSKMTILGEKTALVVRANTLYAFDPDGQPTAQCALTVTTEGSGSVALDPAGGLYDEGTEVGLTATADSGWVFSGWSGDLTGSDNPATIIVDSDKAVTASFSQLPTCTLTMQVSGNGSTDPVVGTHDYPENDIVAITATPDGGWQFDSWAGDVADPASAATTVTMDSDKTVIASFSELEKPDLVVTDVWSKESVVYYQIRNVGEITAPAGHQTALYIDGAQVATDPIAADLVPGARLDSDFEYDWVGTASSDTVKVTADSTGSVEEADETNNSREETWKCDTTPPQITDGPAVSAITRTSATISWVTGEASDSVVKYGTKAKVLSLESSDAATVTDHSINLTDLQPSAVYQFVVESTDASGNTTTSKAGTFETLAAFDDVKPTVSITDPGTCKGITTIVAPASDDTKMNKVEFYLDGVLVFVDYSEPYQLALDTTAYANGDHDLQAKAHDVYGSMAIVDLTIGISNALVDDVIPSAMITAPDDGDTVSGTVDIHVDVSDSAPAVPLQPVSRVEFYVDGDHTWTCYPDGYTATYSWDTQTMDNGEHTVTVTAYDDAENSDSDSITVTVDQPSPLDPLLSVTRGDVQPHGTGFSVTLRVINSGGGTASDIEIVDRLKGFQPLPDVESGYDLANKECEVRLALSELAPHSGISLTYYIVPVLYEVDGIDLGVSYAIGTATGLSYQGPDGEVHEEDLSIAASRVRVSPGSYVDLQTAVGDALGEANYLIVTNPALVFGYNFLCWSDVDNLLSTMAHLAYLKNGVLGYMDTYSGEALERLVNPSPWVYPPNWAARLHPDFSSPLGGYLLIVGETEIVPAWTQSGFDRHWTDGTTTDTVRHSDHPYADTTGDGVPDLIVGRVIGNTAAALTRPLEASIGVYLGLDGYEYDRSDALLMSGTGNCESDMAETVNAIAGILAPEINVTAIDCRNVPGDTTDEVREVVLAELPQKDIIYLFAHGAYYACGVIRNGDIAEDAFAGTNPFVFASSCLTGNYEDAYHDHGIAEAFFDAGAAVYIGSTELSSVYRNCFASEEFFESWQPHQSVGAAFTSLERYLYPWDDRGWWPFWVWEYNLYGDPKFGAAPAAVSLSALAYSLEGEEPPSSVDIAIPDYEVTHFEGLDYVEIPGGLVLLEEGKPRVPYYSYSIDYPQGYEVQDVVMTYRSDPETATGFKLPITTMDVASSMGYGAASAGEGEDWFPEEAYRWYVLQNPDGTTTLVIAMYPFYYSSLTTNVEFYQDYSFNISYIVSTVSITSLVTDQDVYEQGELVTVDAGLTNSGDPQDVFVHAEVKRYGSDVHVDSLTSVSLSSLSGDASYSPTWDSTGFEAGYYRVEVWIEDDAGNTLDTRSVTFTLGIWSADITGLTATPEYFDIGNSIDISLTLENSGTVDISGEALITVQDADGDPVAEFTHDFADLAPSACLDFDDAWDTTGEGEGDYWILATVSYEGQAAVPATATVSTVLPADIDNDGVDTTEEQGPDGTDASYDGNQDGVADSQQDNAASLHTQDAEYYVTLASPEGTTMAGVQAIANPSAADSPANVEFPYGFFEFTLEGVEVGGPTTVTLHLPAGETATTYYKYGPTPDNDTSHWYEFLYDGQTGAEIDDNTITLHFVDGQRGDEDLTANGTIVEPGGPGEPAPAPPTPTEPTVSSVAPGSGVQGETLDVTITGTDLTDASSVEFGNGITVNSFSVDTSTQISASITIEADAATGARDVSVTTEGGTGTLEGGFTVEEADGNGGGNGGDGNGGNGGEAGGCGCASVGDGVSTVGLLVGWALVGLCWGTGYCLVRKVGRRGK